MAAGPRRCPSGARRQPPDPGHCSPRGHVLHLSRRPTGHLNERLRARWRPQGARRSEAPRDGGTQACSARPALSLPSTAAARLSVSPEEARSPSGLARARIPVRAGEAWPLRPSANVPLSSRPAPTHSPSGGWLSCWCGACEGGRGQGSELGPVQGPRAWEIG